MNTFQSEKKKYNRSKIISIEHFLEVYPHDLVSAVGIYGIIDKSRYSEPIPSEVTFYWTDKGSFNPSINYYPVRIKKASRNSYSFSSDFYELIGVIAASSEMTRDELVEKVLITILTVFS